MKLNIPYRLKVSIVFIIIAIGVFISLQLQIDSSNQYKLNLDKAIANSSHSIKISYFDEVLTNTATTVALTGDTSLQKKYKRYADALDKTLKDLQENDRYIKLEVRKIYDANSHLTSFEQEVFSLAKLNQLEKAQDILQSTKYNLYKGEYSAGLNQISQHIENKNLQTVRILSHKQRTNTLANTILLFIVILFGIYLYITLSKLNYLAHIDIPTKLYNRRHGDIILGNEIERANRYDSKFSIILLNIDLFKKTGADFGKNTDDSVLKKVAETLKKHMRKADIISRWSGQEFLIITPKTNAGKATLAGEKIHNIVENFDFGLNTNITISIGVTEYIKDTPKERLIEKVDEALYQAKKMGGNKVCTI